MKPTAEYIREHLHYDPETGDFYWIVGGPGRPIHRPAGGLSKASSNQYWQINIDGKRYMSSHLAWLYVHGEWPKMMDHINHNTLDNRIENLRPCTHSQNQGNKRIPKNNTSGAKGVTWVKSRNRYQVTIGKVFVGRYKTIEEARAAYEAAAKEKFGDFAHT